MLYLRIVFFFFKQTTAYEMRISDWSSDVCSSDLRGPARPPKRSKTTFHFARQPFDFKRSGFAIKSGKWFLQKCRSSALLGPSDARRHLTTDQIGRASCRERVCQYV